MTKVTLVDIVPVGRQIALKDVYISCPKCNSQHEKPSPWIEAFKNREEGEYTIYELDWQRLIAIRSPHDCDKIPKLAADTIPGSGC